MPSQTSREEGGGMQQGLLEKETGQDVSLYTQVPELLASPLHSPMGDYTCRRVQRGSWASHGLGIHSTSQLDARIYRTFIFILLMKTIERKCKFTRRCKSVSL